jgi:hypothetical protein
VGLLLAMARRTALAPVLDPWGGFFPCLAFMDGAETLLLWWNSTCVNGNAFPGFGGRDRLLELLRCRCGSASQVRQPHAGRAAVDAGLGPRRLAALAPDCRSLRQRNPLALAATNPAP